MCERACVCVRAWVRACVRACVCVRACMCLSGAPSAGVYVECMKTLFILKYIKIPSKYLKFYI